MPTMRCPTCGVRFASEGSKAVPFCSERCRQVDLGRWLSEQHSLPRIPDPEDDEPPPEGDALGANGGGPR
jgi:hypothetical protein